MEYVTFKENGTVQEEIKNQNSFVMSSESPLKRKLEILSTRSKGTLYITHNCSAFIIGEQSDIKRTSDDGEPSGTAGVPMLEFWRIIASLIVVSWLPAISGGIKLGAGGLIRAYAGSVVQAVREIGLVEIKEQVVLGITLSYSQYQEFANFLKDHQLAEQDPMFTDQVMTTIL